jgi:photosystem II stability/assembly factor-like uncharacterized protein
VLALYLLPQLTGVAAATSAPILKTLGQIPLHFEANCGQAEARFQFVARGRNHTISLGGTEALFEIHQPIKARSPRSPTLMGAKANRENTQKESPPAAIRFSLVCAQDSALRGIAALPARVNYFLGDDPGQWHRRVPTFSKIEAREVYPGIDLVYYGTGEQLEFDFLLAPNADFSRIALRIDGAESLSLDARGDLVVRLSRGELRQHKPVAYQNISGQRRDVPAAFRLRDRGTVCFELGAYDHSQPLVIDPVLTYSTYFGGNAGDTPWAVAVDVAGSAYIAGGTFSTRLKEPPTPGAIQPAYAGGGRAAGDGFVAKLNPTGTAFDYITYLGGRHEDLIVDLALDPAGNAYVTGLTDSTNFPVTAGAFQPKNAGTNDPLVNVPFTDAFVAKLDPTGSTLMYSTYLGGYGTDAGTSIAVDSAGRACVVGYTDSATVFRATNAVCATVCTNSVCGPTVCETNTFQVPFLVPDFVLTNTQIVTKEMSIDVIETILSVTNVGSTQLSLGFPVLNPIQPYAAGTDANYDVFITKMTPDGSGLVYSTYLGGGLDDLGSSIAVDASGAVTVCGWTLSFDFPVKDAFQRRLLGVQDAFVTKLDASGSALIYSTYLGGTGGDFANSVAVDAAGSAYIIGSKTGNSFPSTPGALNRGGVFVSVDAGANWGFSDNGLDHPLVQALAIAATPPQPTIYAGTQRGVFRSQDGGASWLRSSVGLSNLIVNAITVDPSMPSRLYAGTASAIYTSPDGGLIWIDSSDGLRNDNVKAIAIAPDDPSVLYLGSQRGVFKKTSFTNSWILTSTGLGNKQVNALAIDSLSPTTLYAATEGGVYKSTNAAANWRVNNVGLSGTRVKAIVIDRNGPSTVYAGTTRGFFRSTNAAANWFLLTNGLGRPYITALIADPLMASTLYAGTTNGIFRSLDSGTTWTVITNGLSPRNVASLTIDALTFPATLYAGLYGTNSFGGTNDAFLTKLAPDGQTLGYSFVLGGSKSDQGWHVAVDDSGNAYIIGATDSSNFPVFNVPGTNQFRLRGRIDAFLAQCDANGSALVYSFYLGGTANDYGYSLALDPAANVYATGATFSGAFPVTNAVQPRLAGGSDAFVTKVSSTPAPATPLRAGNK